MILSGVIRIWELFALLFYRFSECDFNFYYWHIISFPKEFLSFPVQLLCLRWDHEVQGTLRFYDPYHLLFMWFTLGNDKVTIRIDFTMFDVLVPSFWMKRQNSIIR